MTAAAAIPAAEPTAEPTRQPQHGNAYNIFILVLTIASLVVMVLLILPLDEDTLDLLRLYDNLICVVFLIDFAWNVATTRPRRYYLVKQRGWLDLLGSIPSFGFFPAAGLFRLFRLSRLARIRRLLQGQNKTALITDVVTNRGQYAFFITVMAAGLVLTSASVLVLQFEGRSSEANITTGGDALWWGIVTITTVGYGDQYPVTPLGRLTGVFVMAAGVGIIGALASILASILVPPAKDTTESDAAARDTIKDAIDDVGVEVASLRAEVAALRATLSRDPPSG
jgi:voltage-gated potassium channel